MLFLYQKNYLKKYAEVNILMLIYLLKKLENMTFPIFIIYTYVHFAYPNHIKIAPHLQFYIIRLLTFYLVLQKKKFSLKKP